jgi:hypothetical protein
VSDAQKAVIACGEAAQAGAASLAQAPGEVINAALHGMAALLTERAPAILAANAADVAEGSSPGWAAACSTGCAWTTPGSPTWPGRSACSPGPRSRPS